MHIITINFALVAQSVTGRVHIIKSMKQQNRCKMVKYANSSRKKEKKSTKYIYWSQPR